MSWELGKEAREWLTAQMAGQVLEAAAVAGWWVAPDKAGKVGSLGVLATADWMVADLMGLLAARVEAEAWLEAALLTPAEAATAAAKAKSDAAEWEACGTSEGGPNTGCAACGKGGGAPLCSCS